MTAFRVAGFTLCFAVLFGCSSANNAPSRATVADKESVRIAPVVNRYKQDALMGFDIKGATLLVSADAEKWSVLDDATESALKHELLAAWVKTWRRYHPQRHARVTVLIRNYYGEEITSLSKAF